jgi:hypothetical protein
MFIICKELIVDDKGHLVKKDCILEFKGFAEDASKLYIISGNERFMIYNEGDIESKIFDNLVSAVLQNKQYIEKNLTVVRMHREGDTYTSVYSIWVDNDGRVPRYDPLEDLIDKADGIKFNSSGCVDCDECCFRTETDLCKLSDNDHDCMLLGFRSKDFEKKKANMTTVEYMSMFDK